MKINKGLLKITIILIGGLIFYSWLIYKSPINFTSPDETVNYYFINLYSKKGTIRYAEPLNKNVDGYLRPRNTINSVGNYVSPHGFMGLFLIYGPISTLISQITLYLTPLIGLLGVLFIYILSYELFDKKNAFISLVIVLFLPPYWFWSSMSMFNNIPATVFFVGGITYLFLAIKKKLFGYYILAAISFGLNHIFRFTDITYFLPLLYILYGFRKEINYKLLSLSFITYLIIVLPAFIINKQYYGSLLAFGSSYTQTSTIADPISSLINKLIFFILPSGFKPNNIIFSFITYCLNFIPIIFLLGLIGITKIKNINDKFIKNYSITFILITIWIIIYYGSGIFWGQNTFTLDSSYIRYFLPIYTLIIPIVSSYLLTLPKKTTLSIIACYIVISILSVFFLNSGLNDMYLRRINAQKNSENIYNATENESIIITTLSDKNIFPKRKVLVYGPVYNDVPPYKKIFNNETLVRYIIKLLDLKKIVYVLNDRKDLDIVKINQLLEKNKLILSVKDQKLQLYEVKELIEN